MMDRDPEVGTTERAEAADDLAARVVATLLSREGTRTAWGLVIEEVRLGYARVRMTISELMLNDHRTAHGGMVFAFADSAFAYACNGRDQATVAQQASLVFLSAAQLGETLVAEAREVALAGRSGVYAVEVRDADGRPVASFQGLSRTVGDSILSGEKP